MKINISQTNDINDVQKIYELTKEHFYLYEQRKEFNIDKVLIDVKNDLDHRFETINRIYKDDIHVGYISIIPRSDAIEITDFYIFDKYQNQGIGTEVLKIIIKNYQHLYLFVFKNNLRAIKLYQTLHFNIVETHQIIYKMGYDYPLTK